MPKGRRVRRVVRHIDTWSVLKVSAFFWLSLMAVILLAGILLWLAGSAFGAIDSVERFMEGLGFKDFEFVGGQLLRGFMAAGLVMVVLATGVAVLMAVVYNLISDLVGGIQVTVLEEEPGARPDSVVVERGSEGRNGAGTTGTDTDTTRRERVSA